MIRLARVSRAKFQEEVAESIGIKQPTYSKIEKGYVHVSPAQLDALVRTLEYPSSFFQQTDRIWGIASPHHRKRQSLTAQELQVLEARLNVIRLNLRRLLESVTVRPHFQFPSISPDDLAGPVAVAQEIRRLWQVPTGPIANVVRMIEDAGGLVMEIPFGTDRCDALSVWGPGEPPVVLLNGGYPSDRKRHTLAHELGHLVMHARDISSEPEEEADEFAAELLMPAVEIRSELRGLRLTQLPDLKRRWGVSMRSLVYRAQKLGEITRDQGRYLYLRLNKEYGTKREPIDVPAERPVLIKDLIQAHFNDLGYSIGEVAALVGLQEPEFRHRYVESARRLHVV